MKLDQSMPEEPKKVSFAAAIAATFRGTAYFPPLLRQTFGRTLWHFGLMALLCAGGIAVARYVSLGPGLAEVARDFAAVFGDIRTRGEIRLPSIEPEKGRSLRLPQQGLLCYVPPGGAAELPPESGVALPRYLIFWTPPAGFMVQPLGETEFMLFGGDFSGGNLQFRPRIDRAGVRGAVEAAAQSPLPAGGEEALLSAASLAQQVRLQLALALFFNHFLSAFAGTLFYLLIFVGMFSLVGFRRRGGLSFRQLFVCALYCSLPVLPVAACFPAFDLPLLSFSSAIMLGTIFYFMAVLGKLELDRFRESEPPL